MEVAEQLGVEEHKRFEVEAFIAAPCLIMLESLGMAAVITAAFVLGALMAVGWMLAAGRPATRA